MTEPARHPRITLTAMSRAARAIAAWRADDDAGAAAVVQESRDDGTVLEFGMAACMLAAQLADKLHGDRAQLVLDALALDAAWFREQELARLEEPDDDAG